jgi:coenzyme F420-dependent glucose-6-phosphate dehydrogenase
VPPDDGASGGAGGDEVGEDGAAPDRDRPGLTIGYWLSSEEHGPRDLVAHGVRAEAAGFTTAMISDHFHPWTRRQGQAPFVWTVVGALAQATERLELGTGVSAPLLRVSPLVLAHAAATVAVLAPGRIFVSVGTGERLNEQVTGQRWPSITERRAALEEAIGVIRRLWDGATVHHRGEHVQVEGAQLSTRPAVPPPLLVAASGRRGAELAGRLGDGLVGVTADAELVQVFESSGGKGKRCHGQVHVCWAEDEAAARRTALEWWPQAALAPALLTELARPEDFEAATADVTEDQVARAVVCGPDPEAHLAAIARFAGAGFDHVYVHQVGPDQDGFFRFYEQVVLPELVRP